MRALEQLMKQKDYRHAQLTNDISSLENQLTKLSIVEMSNKAANNQHKLVCKIQVTQSFLCYLYVYWPHTL